MSTRTVIVSDLSGEPDAVTTRLGRGDAWYEVDLTPAELDRLESDLGAYLAVARRVEGVTPSRRFVPQTTLTEREQIRAWARSNDFALADRGKIPNRIYLAYRAAQTGG